MLAALAATAFAAGPAGAALAEPAKVPKAAKPAPPPVEAPEPVLPESVAQLAQWITDSADNRGLPFAIVDKATAQVFVHAADGTLKGQAPALIGQAPGDDSVPGIGERPLEEILPEERTTPAGRFLAAYGPATGGKSVLWVDYETAVSLHPVVTKDRTEQRLKRLRSPEPDDNRITYGCINVAGAFYTKVVQPTFRKTDSVFYILPETQSLKDAFPGFRPPREARAPGWFGGLFRGGPQAAPEG